jgi:hypothetical protein
MALQCVFPIPLKTINRMFRFKDWWKNQLEKPSFLSEDLRANADISFGARRRVQKVDASARAHVLSAHAVVRVLTNRKLASTILITHLIKFLPLLVCCVLCGTTAQAQDQPVFWKNKQREIHYKPDGEDFLLVNGKKRFNRALYGTNTAFRVEAGDLPEFALYMPGMGGNLKFGIISGATGKWIIDAAKIETRYRPGSMIYTIQDPLIGSGKLHLQVLARADGEGIIVKVMFEGASKDLKLVAVYGGATGKKFSRDGDIGADPESSFYLKPENCTDNSYTILKNTFSLFYGKGRVLSEKERYEIQHFPEKAKAVGIVEKKELSAIFPLEAKLKLGDANLQADPVTLLQSKESVQPLITSSIAVQVKKEYYFLVQNPKIEKVSDYNKLSAVFETAEKSRKILAGRVRVITPDPFINTLGGALAAAADGIWESPSYLHGAVAWRMRLNAWRGAYVADALGWHDRAKLHFSSYAKSQVLQPESAPVVMDTALHLARHQEKMGTSVFSSGYISRNPNDNTKAHHYDMNLVFFDQMLSHFNYTGDLTFIREMWPVIKRHLAWEKRNFDRDDDGLYDAYAAIWASDALQYSGGGVTHSSAYNYRSNKLAARLAKLLGEDPVPYQKEAEKIHEAINSHLWISERGWYAEYKDLLGMKLLHPYAGVWTVYHALDSEVPNAFQAYQALKYVDNNIPRIAVKANGLPDKGYFTISTTNWQPYDWSLNNVALAEVLHTALAYWQGGRSEEAYKLWESILVESMYLSSSPGGFEQLSFYDAIRGELYRDFADPIGMAARSLVEGLYGIKPDALADTLMIRPGFPASWNNASLKVPNISFDFQRQGETDSYTIVPAYQVSMSFKLILPAVKEHLKSVLVNGKEVQWRNLRTAVGVPLVEISSGKAPRYEVKLIWEGNSIEKIAAIKVYQGNEISYKPSKATILSRFDPQSVATKVNKALETGDSMNKTVFYNVKQGDFNWWLPLDVEIVKPVKLSIHEQGDKVSVTVRNSGAEISGKLFLNSGKKALIGEAKLPANTSATYNFPLSFLASGTNVIRFQYGKNIVEEKLDRWDIKPAVGVKWDKVDLSATFNDAVTNIFKNKYLSPRPQGPTLQLPWQGIGNWCYPLMTAPIDDEGLRAKASTKNEILLPNGVPVATPSAPFSKNIVFTSKWDNYPDSIQVALTGKSSHVYVLLAGTTNPMQTRMDNGEILIYYKDGSYERLALRNPDNWAPIEQDYYTDGYAFTAGKPFRLRLKTGEIHREFKDFITLKGYSNFAIDGGAATILDLPLNPDKELKTLKLKTITNDVVIGLMAVTLQK